MSCSSTDAVKTIRADTLTPRWIDWLPCAGARRPGLHEFSSGNRKDWRSPPASSLCCFPTHGECFRAVFDDRVDVIDGDDADKKYGSAIDVSYLEQIRAVLRSELNVTRTLLRSTSRWQSYAPSYFRGPSNWTELHADYYERADYVFTAILYLGEEEGDPTRLVGGETGLADALERTDGGLIRHAAGLRIEPRRGRLVLFTGGGENYHAPLPVLEGRRTTYHAWFHCACRSVGQRTR